MKTIKILTIGLIMLITQGALKAAALEPSDKKSTVAYVVNIYINAMTHGQIKGLEAVIDQNAKFIMLSGKNMLSFTKAELLGSILENSGISQNCSIITAINDDDDELTVVKIDMNYSDFTRSNYITLVNTAEGWKITEVYSVFK